MSSERISIFGQFYCCCNDIYFLLGYLRISWLYSIFNHKYHSIPFLYKYAFVFPKAFRFKFLMHASLILNSIEIMIKPIDEVCAIEVHS